jgi:hypothetical protein
LENQDSLRSLGYEPSCALIASCLTKPRSKAMTDRLSHPNLPTLTNLNWLMWKIAIKVYMKQHDLYCFISTTEPVPIDPTKAKTFKTRKMKASGVLRQHMGMVNYQKFVTKTTKDKPRQMWLKLESHYQSNAIANQAKVYNDFLAF